MALGHPATCVERRRSNQANHAPAFDQAAARGDKHPQHGDPLVGPSLPTRGGRICRSGLFSESAYFRTVTAQVHRAPPTRMVLALVQEQPPARLIMTFANVNKIN